MPAQRDEDRREQTAKQQSQRRKSYENRRKRQAGQQGMGEGVGHQGQSPDDYECAKKSIGESHQHASQKCALHEIVLEGFQQPIHE
jgi:hypothetical protein